MDNINLQHKLEQLEDKILECNEESSNYYQIQELLEEAQNIKDDLESTFKTYIGELLLETSHKSSNDAQNDAKP